MRREHVDHPSCELNRLRPQAAVDGRLTATGLVEREFDLTAKMPQHAHAGLAHAGKKRIGQTSDEEGDAHLGGFLGDER
jgi:hypothetical protein